MKSNKIKTRTFNICYTASSKLQKKLICGGHHFFYNRTCTRVNFKFEPSHVDKPHNKSNNSSWRQNVEIDVRPHKESKIFGMP